MSSTKHRGELLVVPFCLTGYVRSMAWHQVTTSIHHELTAAVQLRCRPTSHLLHACLCSISITSQLLPQSTRVVQALASVVHMLSQQLTLYQ